MPYRSLQRNMKLEPEKVLRCFVVMMVLVLLVVVMLGGIDREC